MRGPGFDTQSGHILSFLFPLIQEGQLLVTGETSKYVQEVLINHLGGLSLPDCPDMTLDVYRGCKTTIQQQQIAVPDFSMKLRTFRITLSLHSGKSLFSSYESRSHGTIMHDEPSVTM